MGKIGKIGRRVICVLVAGILYLVSSAVTDAAIPKYINFQGKLTDSDGNPVADGSYSIKFRLYSAQTGGSALWTETQSVTVTNGVFNAALGTVTTLDLAFDSEYWLSVQVGTDTEMSPRQRLTAAGYAINADNIDTYTSGQFLRSDAADVYNEDGADIDLRFEGDTDSNLLFLDASADKIGLSDATPAALLDVGGGVATNIDGTDDLLIKGDLEVDSATYFQGDVDFADGTTVDFTGATVTGLTGGDVDHSLNDAYDDGTTISVDSGAVTLNDTQTGTANALDINSSEKISGSTSKDVVNITQSAINDTTGTVALLGLDFEGTVSSGTAEGINIQMPAQTDNAINTNATITAYAFKGDGSGISGTTTAYDDIADPDANSTIAFGANTNTWTVGAITSDFFKIDQSGDAGAIDLMELAADDMDIASLLRIDNEGDVTITDGLVFETSGGASSVFTNAINLADAGITNALNIGANNILTSAATISSAELDLLDGKDAALVDTNDAVPTAITGVGTLTSGTWQATDINPDYIAQDGATSGQVLKWDGANWNPADDTDTGTVIAGGTDNYLARFNATGDNVEDSGVVDGSDAVAITIDANEQVGIGDTGPDSPLEVLSTTDPQFRITNTDGIDDFTIGVDTNGDVTLDASGNDLDIQDNVTVGGDSQLGDDNTADTIGINVAPDADNLITASFSESSADTSNYFFNGTFTDSGDTTSSIRYDYGYSLDQNISGSLNGGVGTKQNVYGTFIDLDSTSSVGNSNRGVQDLYGSYVDVNFTGTLGGAGGTSADFAAYGGWFNVLGKSGGVNTTSNKIYGVRAVAGSDLGTTGTAEHYGGYFFTLGTADTNYGVYIDSSGATTNWAVYANAGDNYFADDVYIGATDGTVITLGDTEGIIVGQDDTGYDVKFFGDTPGKYLLWDESADTLYVKSTLAVADGIDAIGAVDMDYGSGDITDHTFTTDGTGDGEIVLPNDSIGPAEIDSTTGAYDFGGVTSFELPNADGPTVNAAGEIGIDTNSGAAGNIDEGVVTYYDGTRQMYGVAVATEPSTDNHVLTYDATNDKYVFEALSSAHYTETDPTLTDNATVSIGDNSSGDVTLTFDGDTGTDGTIIWDVSDDEFDFAHTVTLGTTTKLQFRDTGLFINSSVDGQLDIDADGEVEITGGAIDINSAGNKNITIDAGTTGSITLTAGSQSITDGPPGNVSIIGGASNGNGITAGDAIVRGGSATVANANGGDVLIDGGNKAGSGTAGKIKIGSVNSAGNVQLAGNYALQWGANPDIEIVFDGTDLVMTRLGLFPDFELQTNLMVDPDGNIDEFSRFGPQPLHIGPVDGNDKLYVCTSRDSGSGVKRAFTALSEYTGSNTTSTYKAVGLNSFAHIESNDNMTAYDTFGGAGGGRYVVRQYGTGTINLATGVSTKVFFGADGTIAKWIGHQDEGPTIATDRTITDYISFGSRAGHNRTTDAKNNTITGGTVTTRTGFYMEDWVVSSGTFTNQYGMWLEDLTAATNDYGIRIDGADTYVLWLGAGADNTDAANGITFGSSADTNLYRGAADQLKTDDDFVATGTITATGGLIIPTGTTPAPNIEGALFLDTDAGTNGTLKCYSNGAWRTVQAF